MSVDFGILLAEPARIVVMVVIFVAIKTAALHLLSRHFAIAREQRGLFAVLLSQGGEFAFVVFSAAAAAGIFSSKTAAVLIVVVALSMVATPLMLVIHDKLLAPRFHARPREDDKIEDQENPIIIAGFGRFGQIIGRLLYANRIGVTVLDHDPDQIDLLRKFGFKVFYGDATRIDLLHSAGAAKAKILVVAVRGEFPHLKILARARNVSHYYDLMDRGVTLIERETFEAALQMGRKVLTELGFGAFRARQAAMKFRSHNIKTLEAVYPHYKDQQQMVSMARQAREELEEMFARDAQALEVTQAENWG
jgi:glutathione-regulated potassium-efflux system ancillary protein KefC